MKNLSLVILASLFIFSFSYSQPLNIKSNKYPSLLWEITGNGLTKPSYLFGTMHVSSKMVFHLSDSFYLGIKNADVVALETNAATWQEDLSRYELNAGMSGLGRPRYEWASLNDYLTINTFKAYPYEKLMMQGLYTSPAIINSFLYRNGSETSSDFEEDTYLDLYIFQAGKKWNKKVCGVEDFDKSMDLMKEAYSDAAKEKHSKELSLDVDEDLSYAKMEEAYRTGNLDWLDTINKVNSRSAAFDEKFIYKRNELQANSIDSILKAKLSLFVGVGASHLPGKRGVIELLRAMGYKLRPVKIAERDSRHKDDLEKIKVPVSFSTHTSEDGFFSVAVPGKLYSFTPSPGLLNQQQYADMSNGSYYIVTRIFTNAALWGQTEADVVRKVDSVLYENIPGKILNKQPITRNGYKGFDITNRTRRGDYQRYNIFITPFEIIVFKLSGNGDYVKDSKEADEFFNSIQLRDYKTDWKKYSPSFGGFEVMMPHEPLMNHADNWQVLAYDNSSQTSFEVIRTDIHNTDFAEEDSFDLTLMEESFASSEFISKQISRKQLIHEGYPALDVKYQYKDGSIAHARFLIQGPHYYTLVATSKKENSKTLQFLNSFSIKPFKYGDNISQTDTGYFFTVNSPVELVKKKKLEMYPREVFNYGLSDDDEDALDEKGIYLSKIISCDSTGEEIYVSFHKPSKYYYDDDTSTVVDTLYFKTPEMNWKYRMRKEWKLPDSTTVLEYELGDNRSSRIVHGKSFWRDGIYHHMEFETDSIGKPSQFLTKFLESFEPVDTVTGIDPNKKKTALFFSDFFSTDTMAHKKAIWNIDLVDFDSTDLQQLKKAITTLNWREKKYLDVKQKFIHKLAEIPTKEAANYLKEIYYNSADTLDMQYTVLVTLLKMKNSASYNVFKEIMTNEPPVLDIESSSANYYGYRRSNRGAASYDYDNGYKGSDFLGFLSDSVQLTRNIFKDLLPLISINDYEEPVTRLLTTMVDSNMVGAKDYEVYLQKFLIEARQLLKKQMISEKNKAIEKAQSEQEENKLNTTYGRRDDERGTGNYQLSAYAKLLIPFWDMNPGVPALIEQLLNSNDKRLKYNTMLLLLRNKKTVSDTLINYFASMDEYRYELYTDLRDEKKLNLFPSKYFNQLDLARSQIMNFRFYNSPDSFAFIEKIALKVKERSGFVYFFKYKEKKDDQNWKLATVGLLPSDPKKYEFDNKEKRSEEKDFYFTDVSDTKINNDEPLRDQLNKALKKIANSKRKSAKKFYANEYEYSRPLSSFRE